MAPYWGAHADRIGQRLMAIRAGFGLALTYALMGMCQSPEQMCIRDRVCAMLSSLFMAQMALTSESVSCLSVAPGRPTYLAIAA